MRFRTAALALMLVVSVAGAAATPAVSQQAEGEAYSGAFVQFETNDSAVADYAVDGAVVIENVTAQSASETDVGVGVDVGASTVADIQGSSIESRSQASATASVAFESGAEMEAHDNERGVVQFTASDGSQVVQANVSGEAESESDERVVVSKDDGTQGVFIVVGEGNVTASEEGRVTAGVEEGSQLVYRQYDEERSEEDETQERMIQNGTATAEVYVHEAAESGSDAESDATSVVEYGEDTTVEVQERSESRIDMTVERSESQGKVVIATVSEAAFDGAEDVEVFVDGEAAAQADSYSEVEQSATEGDEPRYYVSQSSSAEATTDVVVGIDHFSERQVSMQSGTPTPTDDSTNGDGSTDEPDDGTTDSDGAGFGVVAALVALASAFVAVRRR